MRISDWSSDVCSSDLDANFFHRSDQEVIIAVAADDGGEQLDHRLSPDRRAQVIPGAITGDAHVDIAAEVRVPQVDWRQTFGLGDQIGRASCRERGCQYV